MKNCIEGVIDSDAIRSQVENLPDVSGTSHAFLKLPHGSYLISAASSLWLYWISSNSSTHLKTTKKNHVILIISFLFVFECLLAFWGPVFLNVWSVDGLLSYPPVVEDVWRGKPFKTWSEFNQCGGIYLSLQRAGNNNSKTWDVLFMSTVLTQMMTLISLLLTKACKNREEVSYEDWWHKSLWGLTTDAGMRKCSTSSWTWSQIANVWETSL